MAHRPAPFVFVRRSRLIVAAGSMLLAAGGAAAMWTWIVTLPLPLTIEEDFHLSGTQILDVDPSAILTSENCLWCHGPSAESDPVSTWSGSKMAHAGRNPLFMAKMTLTNQLVENSGYFCLRCHVPNSFMSGNAYDPSGESLDEYDMDGVSCHFCHSMVDPVYKPGVSPVEDESILAGLSDVPTDYGNSMFVIDPTGTRRGVRGSLAMHDVIHSPFHASSDLCGTCHEVGNPAVSRQPDGSYWFNAIGEPVPDEDTWSQFPLERTYTEWRLSEFAQSGVDLGGRFGGDGHPTGVMHTCQDCHMPRTEGQASPFGEKYPDLARHDFAGSSAWGLQMIGLYSKDDPSVDQAAIQRGIANAVNMLQRAVSLELCHQDSTLVAKVINETGHKIPTGHIEGRRIFLTVSMYGADDSLLVTYGGYDHDEALLDETSTVVYEMEPGISEAGSAFHGLPAGPSMASVVADVIIKDSRIPPRGFNNAAFAAGGAPAVGHEYADGQYWDEAAFAIPAGAVRAEVTVNYQMATRRYIESLRDLNVTNDWGDIIHDLWLQTDKAPPIVMASGELFFDPIEPADLNGDGSVDVDDLSLLLSSWGPCVEALVCPADLDASGSVDGADLGRLLSRWLDC